MEVRLLPVRTGGTPADIAVIYCSAPPFDRDVLEAAVRAATARSPRPAWIALIDDEDQAGRLTVHRGAVVAGRAVTDATKRLEGSHLTETLDRTRLFTVRLPAVLTPASVEAALQSATRPTLHVGDLLRDEPVTVLTRS